MNNKTPSWGESVPWFHAHTFNNPRFAFSSVAGRFVGLTLLGNCSAPPVIKFLEAIKESNLIINDDKSVRFAITLNQQDLQDPLALATFPKQRLFYDEDGSIAREYGALSHDHGSQQEAFSPYWLILDPTLRVYAKGSIDQPDRFINAMQSLPDPAHHAAPNIDLWAPVLLVPRVLETDLCETLIRYYQEGQPEPSGFMRTVDGKTLELRDNNVKRRTDVNIDDETLQIALRQRIWSRLTPEIARAFQFQATRIERYIVACYDENNAGFFKEHRDNTTKGTAHRRFAISINLNSEDYDGGELWFPEYGNRRYKPPTGGAIVFSCSLMHAATPVTRGTRYVTLPFLYDDAAAKIREANNRFLGDGVEPYQSEE
ncbi:2OG-Fe(II) oxygenase [Endozoicomonas sp.]|uniref:2OG-Fe(II) oxygenase n=1 Tax=Endozoicomonas sp. TaxID=1892382 RepID=UPI002888EB1C|nr:2OG-Fe(II) oxygenase [Endozoicomonas sp.]